MKRLINIYLLLPALVLTIYGCQKDEFVGPDVSGLFGVLEVNTPFSHDKSGGVDFTTETVNFTGEFSIQADWNITITGRTSGTTKVIEGNGNNLSTSGGVWNGTMDDGFVRAEWCDIELSFVAFTDTFTDSVQVTNGIDLNNFGDLMSDFEGSASYTFTGASGTDTNAILSSGVYTTDPASAIQGNNYYKLTGQDPGSAFWLGALRWPVTGTITETDPDNIYFNVYVYGLGQNNTRCLFKTTESDGDVWKYQIDVTDPGWQLVSIKFSDMVPDNGSCTCSSVNPELTTQLDIALGTNGVAGHYGWAIDVPILTYDAPF